MQRGEIDSKDRSSAPMMKSLHPHVESVLNLLNIDPAGYRMSREECNIAFS